VNVSELASCHPARSSHRNRNPYRWYEKEREGLGSEFLEAVDKIVKEIAENPERFAIVRRDIRRAVLQRFPYCIFYRIVASQVVVIACFHGKRNPKVWRSRR
jgi:hypothetical protein